VRRLFALAALVAALPLPVAAANAGTIPVPPGGDLSAAYQQAQSGDVIELSTGSYGDWDTPAGTKEVTVRAVAGATPRLRQLEVFADNLTFDGLDLDAEGTKTAGAVFETHGHANITFRNGSIGNVLNEKGVLAGGNSNTFPLNVVFENVDFTGGQTTDPQVHSECIYSQAPGLTVRNSRFDSSCGTTGGVFLTRGSWWGQPQYGGWVFEGNTFERQMADHGGIIFAAACEPGMVCDGATIRGNTFLHSSALPTTTASFTFTNSVESCNTVNGQPVQVGLSGIVHEACNPTPEPAPTPTPTPEPVPTPTPEPDPDPCDRTLNECKADRDAIADKLAVIKRLWSDLRTALE
jgi:hypothetical protein